jgi:hypothetical protein
MLIIYFVNSLYRIILLPYIITMSNRATTDYLIRGVPTALWRRVKAKAAARGTTIRDEILRWLARYGR